MTQLSIVEGNDYQALELIAAELRLRIVQMMGPDKAHHFGGSLSCADIITALYFHALHYDGRNPSLPERDRFVMSKGHSVPAQYAALAMLGVLEVDELSSLKKLGTRLQGHPATLYTPGLEACTGSLGQGLSFATGLALAARIKGERHRVYCLMGDGELHEGQVWEAALDAPKLGLTSVVAIVDHNRLKGMDDCSECAKPLDRIAPRFAACGWRVRDINGHNMAEICEALAWAGAPADAPAAIVAHTVKGKGVSFIENQARFHNSAVTPDQLETAVAELRLRLATLREARA